MLLRQRPALDFLHLPQFITSRAHFPASTCLSRPEAGCGPEVRPTFAAVNATTASLPPDHQANATNTSKPPSGTAATAR